MCYQLTEQLLYVAIYCSKDCKDEFAKYSKCLGCCTHQVPIVNVFVKILLKMIKLAGGVDELRGLLTDAQSRTIFDFDANMDKEAYDKSLVIAFYSLEATSKKEVHPENAATLLYDPSLPFRALWKTEEQRNFLAVVLIKVMSILQTNKMFMMETTRIYNMQEEMKSLPDGSLMFGYSLPGMQWTDSSIGGGLFLFGSLLNHSCDPNVRQVTVDDKIAFVISKPVAAGEQLFIKYFMTYALETRETRQKYYLEYYGFKCDCIACEKNYPLLKKCKKFDPKYPDKAFFYPKKVRGFVKDYKEICRYITNNIQHHPSFETGTEMMKIEWVLHRIAKLSIDDYETIADDEAVDKKKFFFTDQN